MSRSSISRAARKSLKAVIGGSADVVSGYFDHCVNLAAKGQHLQSFVVYDRYPGFALVVSPKHTAEIKSIKDLANKKVGVSAPGSSTDFFLKYILSKNGVDPNSVGVIGVGLGATAIAAMEQGTIDAAIMLDPAVTILQGKDKDLKILSDTRIAEGHARRVRRRISGRRALHQGGLDRLAREGSAGDDQRHRQHAEVDPFAHAGRDRRQDAGRIWSARTRRSTSRRSRTRCAMYSETGRMDPKGAAAVLAVFSQSSPDVAKANIDLSKTYTNKYVDAANKKMGMK